MNKATLRILCQFPLFLFLTFFLALTLSSFAARLKPSSFNFPAKNSNLLKNEFFSIFFPARIITEMST